MENIISRLSSRLKVNSNEPNKEVARLCLADTSLLEEIAMNLSQKDKKLAGDCAEVMTEVALTDPAPVAQYADMLLPLLKHKETRIRWEAMHSIALVAALRPDVIESIMPEILEIINKDGSVIVRDYATDAVSNYARTSAGAAIRAYPVLLQVLDVWQDRHAGRVITGLMNIYTLQPALKSEMKNLANQYKDSPRGVVKKAAVKLEKMLEK